MEIKANFRLSRIERIVKGDNAFYIGHFLDDDDNKYSFFINEKLYNDLSNKKRYDNVQLNLSLYESKKGRYGLGVI